MTAMLNDNTTALATARVAPHAPTQAPSATAKRRITTGGTPPLLRSDWERALFIHYEVDPAALQPFVPFDLNLRDGKAYVSLVAFEMRNMRPHRGGLISAWLSKPVANHGFLNVRTYVIRDGEPGIFFLAEWLPNLLSVLVGPRLFGLPYRFGRLDYQHDHETGELIGQVSGSGQHGRTDHLSYHATVDGAAGFHPCEADSLTEFLLEQYTAYTERGGVQRRFRVWHEPWPQVSVEVDVEDASLIKQTGSWMQHARCIGGNYSTGVTEVEISRPQCINGPHCERRLLR